MAKSASTLSTPAVEAGIWCKLQLLERAGDLGGSFARPRGHGGQVGTHRGPSR